MHICTQTASWVKCLASRGSSLATSWRRRQCVQDAEYDDENQEENGKEKTRESLRDPSATAPLALARTVLLALQQQTDDQRSQDEDVADGKPDVDALDVGYGREKLVDADRKGRISRKKYNFQQNLHSTKSDELFVSNQKIWLNFTSKWVLFATQSYILWDSRFFFDIKNCQQQIQANPYLKSPFYFSPEGEPGQNHCKCAGNKRLHKKEGPKFD